VQKNKEYLPFAALALMNKTRFLKQIYHLISFEKRFS